MKISQTVFELQSGHDFVTDRRTDGWTDQGKNNISPNPTWGDIIKRQKVIYRHPTFQWQVCFSSRGMGKFHFIKSV